MYIDVTRTNEDALTERRWRFYICTGLYRGAMIDVTLDRYTLATRPSKRHKFKAEYAQTYTRTDSRDSGLAVHDVPAPDDVRREAIIQTVQLIRLCVADRRGVIAPFGQQENVS